MDVRYQRTHSTITSRSKCRPLNRSSTDSDAVIPSIIPVHQNRPQFAPEPVSKYPPVSENPRTIFLHPGEPFHAAPLMPRQRLVLASGPLLELAVDVSKELAHRSLIESPIVFPPPAYHRVVLLRQFGQRRRRLARNAPTSHHLPHALH